MPLIEFVARRFQGKTETIECADQGFTLTLRLLYHQIPETLDGHADATVISMSAAG
jgi:hypothetical protein